MEKGVKIIAEAGVNHNGELSLAKGLVDAAAAAGADYVKFQTFTAKKLVSKNAKKASYQIENTESSESQLQMLQKLELDQEAHYELIRYCEEKRIKFLSTAFDLDNIDFLDGLHMTLYKIPSGEITNLPYLRKVGGLSKPIVMSTGMAVMDDIENALEVLLQAGAKKEDITVLHCNTEYPTPMKDVNLLAMRGIQEKFDVAIGYSDHTLGIEVPIAAVALGAKVIEKHFTLDRTMDGPDHKASLEPQELKAMVSGIRNIETALGSKEKTLTESEAKNINIVRKSIVAGSTIKKGDVFTAENLTVKRPGHGISPMLWDSVIGTVATKDYEEDDLI